MKILIPIPGFARGGGNRVLAEFANNWIIDGHKVDFLVNESSSQPYFPTNAQIIWSTSSGKLITEGERNNRHPRISNGWIKLIGLYRAMCKIGNEYDIILANHSLTVWPVYFANCGKAKKAYYIQAYEPEYSALEKGIKARVIEWLSKKSYSFDLIQICNAPIYIGYKGIRAQEWVPPGINFDLFYPKKVYKDISKNNQIILGCIGRTEPTKGIKYALMAFEALYARDQRYRLHVAFGNLPESWKHVGLVVVVPKNDAELAEYYRSIDIMLAPGTVQLGAPHYPVLEAMASGVPVVTTGYMPADNSNSWIVEVGDPHSIVQKVEEIVSDNAYQGKVNNALMAVSEFSWEKVAKKMMGLMINLKNPE